MKIITVTELARNLSRVLDELATERQEIVIERNRRQVARLLPGPVHQTALEALSDLYRTLPEDVGSTWEADGRKGPWKGDRLDNGVRDPWAS